MLYHGWRAEEGECRSLSAFGKYERGGRNPSLQQLPFVILLCQGKRCFQSHGDRECVQKSHRKVAATLVPDELLQGLEGTAVGKLPNSNIWEKNGLQGCEVQFGDLAGSLSWHVPAGGTRSSGAAAGGAGLSQSTFLPARSTWGMGQGCWLLGFHIRGGDGQSKGRMQPKSGKHGDKVIDTTLAQSCNAMSQQLI